jgi:hypothetical protein
MPALAMPPAIAQVTTPLMTGPQNQHWPEGSVRTVGRLSTSAWLVGLGRAVPKGS